MKLELEIPEGYEMEVKEFVKGIDWGELFMRALRREVQEELEMAWLKRIASKSKLTEERALALGEKVKEGIARRHGVL